MTLLSGETYKTIVSIILNHVILYKYGLIPRAISGYMDRGRAILPKMVAGHVTAYLIGCGMLGKSGGVSLFWHSHWMVCLFWDQSILSSPSTVLMDWFGDIP